MMLQHFVLMALEASSNRSRKRFHNVLCHDLEPSSTRDVNDRARAASCEQARSLICLGAPCELLASSSCLNKLHHGGFWQMLPAPCLVSSLSACHRPLANTSCAIPLDLACVFLFHAGLMSMLVLSPPGHLHQQPVQQPQQQPAPPTQPQPLPQHMHARRRTKAQICEAYIQRLAGRGDIQLDPAFVASIRRHFDALPTRYALDVNVDSLDVLSHKRLLDEARQDPSAVSFAIRPVEIVVPKQHHSTGGSSEHLNAGSPVVRLLLRGRVVVSFNCGFVTPPVHSATACLWFINRAPAAYWARGAALLCPSQHLAPRPIYRWGFRPLGSWGNLGVAPPTNCQLPLHAKRNPQHSPKTLSAEIGKQQVFLPSQSACTSIPSRLHSAGRRLHWRRAMTRSSQVQEVAGCRMPSP
jgi:hypothetical protein